MPKMKKFTAGLLVFLVVLAMPFCTNEKYGGFWDALIFGNEAWAMVNEEAVHVDAEIEAESNVEADAIYVSREFILPTGQTVLAQKLAADEKEAEAQRAAEAKKQAELKAKVEAEAKAKADAKAKAAEKAKRAAQAEKAKTTAAKPAMSSQPEGEHGIYLGEFEITAYCSCTACCGKGGGTHTANGSVPKVGYTVAVDPRVIKMNSQIYIEGMGARLAQDTGGLIKGKRLDIYMADHKTALKWGRQTRKVWLQK